MLPVTWSFSLLSHFHFRQGVYILNRKKEISLLVQNFRKSIHTFILSLFNLLIGLESYKVDFVAVISTFSWAMENTEQKASVSAKPIRRQFDAINCTFDALTFRRIRLKSVFLLPYLMQLVTDGDGILLIFWQKWILVLKLVWLLNHFPMTQCSRKQNFSCTY